MTPDRLKKDSTCFNDDFACSLKTFGLCYSLRILSWHPLNFPSHLRVAMETGKNRGLGSRLGLGLRLGLRLRLGLELRLDLGLRLGLGG